MQIIDPDAQIQLARLHEKAGNPAAAEQTLRELLQAFPLNAAALNLLSAMLTERGRAAEALALIQHAADAAPNDEPIQNTLAAFLANRGDLDRAAAIWHRLHAANPAVADYCHNLGRLARHQGRLDDAIAWYYKALKLQPASLPTCEQLSDILRERHDYVACGQVLAGAITYFPDNTSLHLRLSYALMMTGQLAAGWSEFEWRWRSSEMAARRHAQKPEWNGEDLRGKTILLYCEQGIGDTLHFVRYAEILAAGGAKVIVECQPEVKPLLIHMPSIVAVRAVGEPIPAFDFQLPLMSVPRVIGISMDSIPAKVSYLAPDPRKIKTWAQRLSSTSQPPRRRIGLVWAGNAVNPNDKRRSIPLSRFAPLAQISNLELYSLQKGKASADVAAAKVPIIDHTRHLTNFEETAALIANLDLVITIDTAVAHLAGAMNRPVWTLLADLCDWRWLATREDSPWYPSMKLFRQQIPDDWSAPLHSIQQELNALTLSP